MGKAIVVLVEATIEPETAVEHESADERARPVARALDRARERRHSLVEAEPGVAVDAVARRQ